MKGCFFVDIANLYQQWKEKATLDPDLIPELISVENDNDAINDMFYRELEFGTAGLRGVIGAGTNRMNVYTVGRASQGIADYVNSVNTNGSIAIAYDSRIKSQLFAETAARVFAANGIKAYLYDELMPTPMLSFAVRYLKCDAGVVITASHNPAKYNGYKAYGPDGCQLNIEASNYVFSYIEKTDFFEGIKLIDFEDGLKNGKIEYIKQDVIDAFLDNSESQSLIPDIFEGSDFSVIYTPLHGTGNKPVREILKRRGVKNVTIVTEQELPDGNFPTAPYPNPELSQPFECALKLAEKIKPDILLATDPDADRVGIAVCHKGKYELMSGNQVGALLSNYVLSVRSELGTLPKNPILVKTIVSTELCQKIADKYGCQLVNVLTGFKFIGEQILGLEQKGEENRFVFGFEESYGYLSGTFVRDKDAVTASMLICEMACYYRKKGMNLFEALESIENELGFYTNKQSSYTFEGQKGMLIMADIMKNLRVNPPKQIAGFTVCNIFDYGEQVAKNLVDGTNTKIDLPSSNVIEFKLDNGCSFIVRPSGTEPKIKIYLSTVGSTKEESIEICNTLKVYGDEMMKI